MPGFTRKCGVICMTLIPKGREYVLSCEFCDCLFSQLDNFILHIEYEHQSNIMPEPMLDGTLEKLEVTPLQQPTYDIKRILRTGRPRSNSCESQHFQTEDLSPNIVKFEHKIVDIKKDITESEYSYDHSNEEIDDTDYDMHNVNKSDEFEKEIVSEENINEHNLFKEEDENFESENGIYTYGHFVDINIGRVDDQINENSYQECEKKVLQRNLLNIYGKDRLVAILSACLKHPILWDKSAPQANNGWFREKAYKSIANGVGKLNEWKIVRDIIQRLRIRIHNQMQKKKLAEINNELYTPLWENDIIEFLKPTVKKKEKKSQKRKVNKIEEEASTSLNETTFITVNPDENSYDDESTEIKSNSNDDNVEEINYEFTETESDSEHPFSPMTVFDKETMSAIFSSYTHHGILWDINDPMYKNKKLRKKAYMSIASEVGKSSEWRTIQELFQRLRFRLQKEVQRKKLAELDNEPFVPSWEQDLTSFLTPKTNTYIPISRKFKLPDSKLADWQCLEFIKIYKSFNCLWDEQDITYRFNNRRQEALTSIQELLKSKVGVSLTPTELDSEIVRLRKMCSLEKDRKLKCERTNSIYKPDCKFYDKLIFLEVDVGPFQCSVCGDIMQSPTQYKIHKSTHDGSMPFSCVICQQGFKSIGNLAVHLRRHTRDYEFECDICKKRYATSTDLKRHKRGHTGEKPYFCDICGQSFRGWSIFDTHCKRHKNIRSHKCDVCSKKFFSRSMLLDHKGTHLTVRDQMCNICGKGFTTKKHLRQHKQIHESKKKYVCKICGKQFAQCAGLSGHMKTHGKPL